MGRVRKLCHRWFCGQDKDEPASALGLALGPDASSVALADRLGDVQPQPEAAPIAVISLEAAVEDLFEQVRRDSFAGVLHHEADATFPQLDAHRDAAALGSELDRVADEIGQHLEDPFVVELEGPNAALD